MGSGHRPVISLPFLLLLLSLILPFSTPTDLDTDRSALLALRSAVGRSNLTSWNATASACSFQGVKCGGSRVTALRLPGSGLIGPIPAGTLGNLTAIRIVNLRFNALSGPLPSDLAALSQLRSLYLHNNRFSGEIPPPLLAITGLVRLNLADNNFSGDIPAAFNNLTRLETLYLERNSLSGFIPDLTSPISSNSMSPTTISMAPYRNRCEKCPKMPSWGCPSAAGPFRLAPERFPLHPLLQRRAPQLVVVV